jgi:probable rRNA maturation factor
MNETHLKHAGSTDVITFDYLGERSQERVHGEILICVDEAVKQAKRFKTGWEEEIKRYVAHGILHLIGYDDGQPRKRKAMKVVEDELVAKARKTKLRIAGRKPGKALP